MRAVRRFSALRAVPLVCLIALVATGCPAVSAASEQGAGQAEVVAIVVPELSAIVSAEVASPSVPSALSSAPSPS